MSHIGLWDPFSVSRVFVWAGFDVNTIKKVVSSKVNGSIISSGISDLNFWISLGVVDVNMIERMCYIWCHIYRNAITPAVFRQGIANTEPNNWLQSKKFAPCLPASGVPSAVASSSSGVYVAVQSVSAMISAHYYTGHKDNMKGRDQAILSTKHLMELKRTIGSGDFTKVPILAALQNVALIVDSVRPLHSPHHKRVHFTEDMYSRKNRQRATGISPIRAGIQSHGSTGTGAQKSFPTPVMFADSISAHSIEASGSIDISFDDLSEKSIQLSPLHHDRSIDSSVETVSDTKSRDSIDIGSISSNSVASPATKGDEGVSQGPNIESDEHNENVSSNVQFESHTAHSTTLHAQGNAEPSSSEVVLLALASLQEDKEEDQRPKATHDSESRRCLTENSSDDTGSIEPKKSVEASQVIATLATSSRLVPNRRSSYDSSAGVGSDRQPTEIPERRSRATLSHVNVPSRHLVVPSNPIPSVTETASVGDASHGIADDGGTMPFQAVSEIRSGPAKLKTDATVSNTRRYSLSTEIASNALNKSVPYRRSTFTASTENEAEVTVVHAGSDGPCMPTKPETAQPLPSNGESNPAPLLPQSEDSPLSMRDEEKPRTPSPKRYSLLASIAGSAMNKSVPYRRSMIASIADSDPETAVSPDKVPGPFHATTVEHVAADAAAILPQAQPVKAVADRIEQPRDADVEPQPSQASERALSPARHPTLANIAYGAMNRSVPYRRSIVVPASEPAASAATTVVSEATSRHEISNTAAVDEVQMPQKDEQESHASLQAVMPANFVALAEDEVASVSAPEPDTESPQQDERFSFSPGVAINAMDKSVPKRYSMIASVSDTAASAVPVAVPDQVNTAVNDDHAVSLCDTGIPSSRVEPESISLQPVVPVSVVDQAKDSFNPVQVPELEKESPTRSRRYSLSAQLASSAMNRSVPYRRSIIASSADPPSPTRTETDLDVASVEVAASEASSEATGVEVVLAYSRAQINEAINGIHSESVSAAEAELVSADASPRRYSVSSLMASNALNKSVPYRRSVFASKASAESSPDSPPQSVPTAPSPSILSPDRVDNSNSVGSPTQNYSAPRIQRELTEASTTEIPSQPANKEFFAARSLSFISALVNKSLNKSSGAHGYLRRSSAVGAVTIGSHTDDNSAVPALKEDSVYEAPTDVSVSGQLPPGGVEGSADTQYAVMSAEEPPVAQGPSMKSRMSIQSSLANKLMDRSVPYRRSTFVDGSGAGGDQSTDRKSRATIMQLLSKTAAPPAETADSKSSDEMRRNSTNIVNNEATDATVGVQSREHLAAGGAGSGIVAADEQTDGSHANGNNKTVIEASPFDPEVQGRPAEVTSNDESDHVLHDVIPVADAAKANTSLSTRFMMLFNRDKNHTVGQRATLAVPFTGHTTTQISRARMSADSQTGTKQSRRVTIAKLPSGSRSEGLASPSRRKQSSPKFDIADVGFVIGANTEESSEDHVEITTHPIPTLVERIETEENDTCSNANDEDEDDDYDAASKFTVNHDQEVVRISTAGRTDSFAPQEIVTVRRSIDVERARTVVALIRIQAHKETKECLENALSAVRAVTAAAAASSKSQLPSALVTASARVTPTSSSNGPDVEAASPVSIGRTTVQEESDYLHSLEQYIERKNHQQEQGQHHYPPRKSQFQQYEDHYRNRRKTAVDNSTKGLGEVEPPAHASASPQGKHGIDGVAKPKSGGRNPNPGANLHRKGTIVRAIYGQSLNPQPQEPGASSVGAPAKPVGRNRSNTMSFQLNNKLMTLDLAPKTLSPVLPVQPVQPTQSVPVPASNTDGAEATKPKPRRYSNRVDNLYSLEQMSDPESGPNSPEPIHHRAGDNLVFDELEDEEDDDDNENAPSDTGEVGAVNSNEDDRHLDAEVAVFQRGLDDYSNGIEFAQTNEALDGTDPTEDRLAHRLQHRPGDVDLSWSNVGLLVADEDGAGILNTIHDGFSSLTTLTNDELVLFPSPDARPMTTNQIRGHRPQSSPLTFSPRANSASPVGTPMWHHRNTRRTGASPPPSALPTAALTGPPAGPSSRLLSIRKALKRSILNRPGTPAGFLPQSFRSNRLNAVHVELLERLRVNEDQVRAWRKCFNDAVVANITKFAFNLGFEQASPQQQQEILEEVLVHATDTSYIAQDITHEGFRSTSDFIFEAMDEMFLSATDPVPPTIAGDASDPTPSHPVDPDFQLMLQEHDNLVSLSPDSLSPRDARRLEQQYQQQQDRIRRFAPRAPSRTGPRSVRTPSGPSRPTSGHRHLKSSPPAADSAQRASALTRMLAKVGVSDKELELWRLNRMNGYGDSKRTASRSPPRSNVRDIINFALNLGSNPPSPSSPTASPGPDHHKNKEHKPQVYRRQSSSSSANTMDLDQDLILDLHGHGEDIVSNITLDSLANVGSSGSQQMDMDIDRDINMNLLINGMRQADMQKRLQHPSEMAQDERQYSQLYASLPRQKDNSNENTGPMREVFHDGDVNDNITSQGGYTLRPTRARPLSATATTFAANASINATSRPGRVFTVSDINDSLSGSGPTAGDNVQGAEISMSTPSNSRQDMSSRDGNSRNSSSRARRPHSAAGSSRSSDKARYEIKTKDANINFYLPGLTKLK
jgi:hypothetical protein